jgi:hypothetical protein
MEIDWMILTAALVVVSVDFVVRRQFSWAGRNEIGQEAIKKVHGG